MSEPGHRRQGTQQQGYTSFDQFIAQNDFSQLNNNNNYLYSPSGSSGTPQHQQYFYPSASQFVANYSQAAVSNFTLTADATEFVPRIVPDGNSSSISAPRVTASHQQQDVYVPSHQSVPEPVVPLANLTLHENNNFPTGAGRPGSGAVPKQQVNGNGRTRNGRTNNNAENNGGRRQQQQQQGKSSRQDRRRPDYEFEDHSQWNGYDHNGHSHGRQFNHGGHAKSSGESAVRHHPNRDTRQNRNAESLVFRNGGASHRPDKQRPPKPTDFQPNRNLKPPASRHLDHPVDISQREKQILEIDAGYLECLVCCETIKPAVGTWNCKNCYHILHLSCTTKWATRSKSEDGWRCPACQNLTRDVPYDYLCFCGKQRNPQYNRNDVAHSCGDVCARQSGCAHPCTLLCHPGACPTCQASVVRTCGCGATEKTMICSQDEAITCEGICEKMRNCGLHRCSAPCHVGECAECAETLQHECHCGRETREVQCTRENLEEMKFACESACAKELDCGGHKCERQCHAGPCSPCDLTPDRIRACPCGKKPILAGERKSCQDEIPLCGAVCNKILSCGAPSSPHRCGSPCHLGACPPCQKQTAVKCRCGQMDQMVKCRQLTTRADDARCKKKCPKKRSCGKHRCNLECCIDIDHICPLPCPSTLSCGKHKCERTCHPGHCQQCPRMSFNELHCECGAQVIFPPVPCGTKKPTCDKPCTRSHACAHAVLHNCHTGAVCPPCMLQTTQSCYGQHEQRRTIPCSQQSFSCGMPCNRELPCKEHRCIKTCHEGECVSAGGEVCKQSCVKARAICGHKCMAPCHVGDECPETMCKETVEVVCQCGVRKLNRMCHDFANDFKRIATAQLASSLQDMSSGSGLKDILGPIKWTTAKKLDCDDNCAIVERNRRMAIGLQIRNPDLGSKLQTKYSDYLKNWAKEDPRFVEMVHDKLTELVKLAKESKQKSRSHSFPVMNREKRHCVHDMCEVFGVESKAYDAEPQRNIVATAFKDRSWLPGQSIMEVMKRESGLRRVPGPAWGMKRT